MGRAIGSVMPVAGTRGQAADRVDGGGLLRLLLAQGGQNAGQTARQHALAGAGRAYEQQVVAAGGGDLQRPLGLGLADHILQIRHIGQGIRGLGIRQRQLILTSQPGGDGQQLMGGAHLGILDEGGLRAVLPRHQQGAPRVAAGEHGRQHSEHGPDLAGQGQFPQKFMIEQVFCRYLLGSGENADGDGQIEAATLLGQIGGGQIDRDVFGRELEVAVEQGAAHPIPRLLHRGFRQAHHVESGQAVGEVNFHRDLRCRNPQAGTAINHS